MDSIRPVWAEINLNNLKSNIKAIKSKVGDKEIIATVKANAYGHGAVDVAQFYWKMEQQDWLLQ